MKTSKSDLETASRGIEEIAAKDPVAEAVRGILHDLGENPEREGLAKTPARVAESLRFLTQGYEQDVDEVVNGALYSVSYDEMVIVKDIEIFSLCEHHLLPFFGKWALQTQAEMDYVGDALREVAVTVGLQVTGTDIRTTPKMRLRARQLKSS